MNTKLSLGALLVAVLAGLPLHPTVAADNSALKAAAMDYIDAESAILAQTSRAIWSYAETSLEESQSSAVLQDLLRASDFEVEAGVAGMPTAFVATYGSGAPVIGILAEYDALPGVSQAATPTPQTGPNPLAGHACGHSVFGAGSAGAALALAELMRTGKLSGTLRLYGTPAEETGIGKVYMLRAGLFDDVDVMLGWHPGSMTLVPYGTSMALVNVKVRFRGAAAHAAAQPYAGRSALDAVELMNMGVNMMREHVKDDARIHYVITNGGGQPNVVPPEAEVWYYIRAYKFTDVVAYFERFKEIAAGAAQMTQTAVEAIEIQSEIHEMIPVRSLAEVMHANLTAIGPPAWSAAELEFARATQKNYVANALSQLPADAPALHAEILPLPPQPIKGSASTDIGDISWFVPVGNVMVAGYGYGLPTHSWPVVAASGSAIGDRALIVAAKAIAATAIDIYRDPELLAAIQADFKATRGTAPWQTLIPEGQQAPRQVR
ncbi:MAG: amidohydrolase [Gammaproteobacteria bacterium]|jgi:aminobenzoyl-glutamate utilization protein B|nr:amidohydrolase [Gammaproteobacteria bacterium]